MPEISILLPSLRKEAALQRIKEFAETNGKVDYEIILVSPFAVKASRVIHILEDQPRGVVYAGNQAYRRVSGSFITWWSDDARPTRGCLKKMLDFMNKNPEPFMGSFRLKDSVGRELDPVCVYGRLYARWGMASKKTLSGIGGCFNPVYKSYWADPDMSLRVWSMGGRVETCRNAWLIISQIEDCIKLEAQKKSYQRDAEIFLNHWHDRLGEGRPRPLDLGEINCSIKKRPTFRCAFAAITNRVPGVKRAKEVIKKTFLKTSTI